MSRVSLANVFEMFALDSNGDPASGAVIQVYPAGTTDLISANAVSLTTDLAGTTAALLANRTADAEGRFAALYLEPQSIKIVVEDSDGATLFTIDDLLASSSLDSFDSRTAAIAANINPSVNAIRTAGFATRGDGGGGLYARVDSEPAHIAKIQSADGAHWEFVPENGVITTKQTGAVCDVATDFNATNAAAFAAENTLIDAATDDTAAIQGAVDFALYHDGNTFSAEPVKVVHVGRSRITDTIHLGYGTNNSMIVFEGVSIAPLRGENSYAGSSLACTFTDRLMINAQGTRDGALRGIYLRGGLDYTGIGATGKSPTELATWEAVRAANRYAPHGLVGIDAYCGTRPATSYPDVTYPAFLGAVSQYNKNISSRFTIENVQGRNAQVGVVVKPSDNANNADFVRVLNCFFEFVQDAVSIGNGQSRNFALRDCEVANAYAGLTNRRHGRQGGQIGGPIDNFSVGGFCALMFDFDSTATIGGSTSITNVFAEELHQFINIEGATSADAPLNIGPGKINLRWDDDNGVPPHAGSISNCTAVLEFDHVSFFGFPDALPFYQAKNVKFRNCDFADTEPTTLAGRIFLNGTMGVITSLAPGDRAHHTGRFSQRDLVSGAETSTVLDSRLSRTGVDYNVPIWADVVRHSGSSTECQAVSTPRPHYRNSVAKSTAWSGASRSGRTITATYTGTTVEALKWTAGDVGDVCYDSNTGTTLRVETAVQNGSDVDMTYTLLTNYISDGSGGYDLFDTDFSLTTGNVEFANCRVFATRAPLYGVATSGSTTLACRSGNATTVANILSDLSAGNLLFSASRRHNHFTSETAAEISTITSPNITMGDIASETWGTTNSPVEFDWWVQ